MGSDRDVAGSRPDEIWWVTALALFTGQRQGDVLQMKWSDVRDGVVSVIQEKTGVRVWIPIHRALAKSSPRCPADQFT